MIKNPNLKTVCDNCSANYIVKHDLTDDYIEQFCPFCGEEHEEVEEHITDIDENWN
jgi:Zn finger protein HypA/HybF involved in hydrogenase expression